MVCFSWHGRVSEYVVIGVIFTGFLKCGFLNSRYFFRGSVIFMYLPFQMYWMQSVSSISVYLLKVRIFKPQSLVLQIQNAGGIGILAILQ